MPRPVLIVGRTGSGKSTSISKLDPEKTCLISISKTEKPLPWKGFSKGYVNKRNLFYVDTATRVEAILEALKKQTKFTTVIIDDAQYIMAFEFLKRCSETGFTKFNQMAQNFINIIEMLNSIPNINKFILMHDDTELVDGMQVRKAKTLGKMIDSTISLEGLFDTVLFTEVIKGDSGMEYYFRVKPDGLSTAKSPVGMFDQELIPNDLSIVVKALEEYDK